METVEFPKSTRLKSAAYDPDTRELTIIFRSSATPYHYHNVDPAYFEGLKNAASAGKHFEKNIKNKFGYRKGQAR